MRLVLMHMHDELAPPDAGEEVMLIVPGAAEKVAFAVPLAALDTALPVVAEAAEGVDQVCHACGEDLAVVPRRTAVRR